MAKVRNSISGLIHCIAAGLSLVALVILIIYAAINGDAFDIVSFSLFGTALLLYYLFSTLYHWLNISEKGLNIFKKFENVMIYFLIGSSFTPICFGPLLGPWGWSIFGVIWGFSITGLTLSAIWVKLPKIVNIILSIILGIIILITLFPLIQILKISNTLSSLFILFSSLVFYIVGGLLPILKWPKTKLFGFHEISHIFIFLGSIFHFIFVLNYITIF